MELQFRFMRFKVYTDAKQFYKRIVTVTKKYPYEYHELGDQMRRSSLSVILNIAEGSGKHSDKDFNRYIKNSLGSINETAAGIDISYESHLIPRNVRISLLNEAKTIADQLGGLSKHLNS